MTGRGLVPGQGDAAQGADAGQTLAPSLLMPVRMTPMAWTPEDLGHRGQQHIATGVENIQGTPFHQGDAARGGMVMCRSDGEM